MLRSPVRWLIVMVILTFAGNLLPALAQDATHVVLPGENLYRIALRYGVSIDELARANGIINTWNIAAGQTLIIPLGEPELAEPVTPSEDPEPAAPEPEPIYHTIQRGENLLSIAQRYGLTPEQIMEANQLTNPHLIYSGQQLLISAAPPVEVAAVPEPAPEQPAPAPVQMTYTVQRGDHLSGIAMQFGVPASAIVEANGLPNADHIEAGQVLIIPNVAADVAADATGADDLGILSNLPAAPAAPIANGKFILVDLSDSRVYAYEDGVLVRNVLVSTGLPGTPTVQGDFSIYVKYPSQLMAGPGYYLPDVPYVMYFYQGYGLHGTYWHNNFGSPMSHGCVNLPTPEAEWFYNWAPVGTPVRVVY